MARAEQSYRLPSLRTNLSNGIAWAFSKTSCVIRTPTHLGEAQAHVVLATAPLRRARSTPILSQTMRLIAERLLPEGHAPLMELGQVPEQVQGPALSVGMQLAQLGDTLCCEGAMESALECFSATRKAWRKLMMRVQRRKSPNLLAAADTSDKQAAPQRRLTSVKPRQIAIADRLYVSESNEGAMELAQEVGDLAIVRDASEISSCVRFLLYLDGRTWTRGARSETLASELVVAMRAGVKVIMAHEMPGVGQPVHAVPFARFFACPEGATPPHLLRAGIYKQLAVPLKGGAWRIPALRQLRKELAKPLDASEPLAVDDPTSASETANGTSEPSAEDAKDESAIRGREGRRRTTVGAKTRVASTSVAKPKLKQTARERHERPDTTKAATDKTALVSAPGQVTSRI